MAAEEDILCLLLPVFNDGLSDEDINKLANMLLKSRHISKDGLQAVTESDGIDKIKVLFDKIKQTSKLRWQYVISSYIEMIDKPNVASIVERSFDNDENILWILRSWNDLVNMESVVKDIAWMISQKEISGTEWLLEFAYSVASAEADSETTKTAINLLQKRMSETSSMSFSEQPSIGVSGFESILTQSLLAENVVAPECFSPDVKPSFPLLIPILDDSLTHDEIVCIARPLRDNGFISESCFKKMKDADTETERENRTASKFVNYLTTIVELDWKNCLMDTLKLKGPTEMCNIIDKFLSARNEGLNWLLQNWDQIKQNETILKKILSSHELLKQIDTNKRNWQLEMIDFSLRLDENSMKQFIDVIKQCLNQSDVAVEQPQLEPPKPQAIKREYVTTENQGESDGANKSKIEQSLIENKEDKVLHDVDMSRGDGNSENEGSFVKVQHSDIPMIDEEEPDRKEQTNLSEQPNVATLPTVTSTSETSTPTPSPRKSQSSQPTQSKSGKMSKPKPTPRASLSQEHSGGQASERDAKHPHVVDHEHETDSHERQQSYNPGNYASGEGDGLRGNQVELQPMSNKLYESSLSMLCQETNRDDAATTHPHLASSLPDELAVFAEERNRQSTNQESIQSQPSSQGKHEAPPELDVKPLLPHLVPMLDDCLTVSEIIVVARPLRDNGFISKDEFGRIKYAEKVAERQQRAASKFINSLMGITKQDWKHCFLDAIKATGHKELYNIIDVFLSTTNEPLHWFLQNWDQIQENKMIIKKILSHHELLKQINTDILHWQLAMINSVLSFDENMMKEFMNVIQQCLNDSSPKQTQFFPTRQQEARREDGRTEQNDPATMKSSQHKKSDDENFVILHVDENNDRSDNVTPNADETMEDDSQSTSDGESEYVEASSDLETSNQTTEANQEGNTGKTDNRKRQHDNDKVKHSDKSQNKREKTEKKNEALPEVSSHQDAPPPSYADATKGRSTGGKPSKETVKQELRIKEKPCAMQEYSQDYYQNLASHGEYLIEFRAKLPDNYQMLENTMLCVYFGKQESFYPMYNDKDVGAFRLMLQVPRMYDDIYKYCVLLNGEVIGWEYLPPKNNHSGIRNRKLEVQYDQKNRGHAIMFDVVVFTTTDFGSYEGNYQKYLSRFLPNSERIVLDESDTSSSLINLHKTYIEWFITSENGVTIVHQQTYGVTKVTYGKHKKQLVQGYTDHIVKMLSGPTDIDGHMKRVLCILAFATAMQRKLVSFDDDELKANICNGLSLHDIDEEHQTLLLVHLNQFMNQWNLAKMETRSTSLKSTLEDIFKQLSKLPESTLVLPFLKLVQDSLGDYRTDHSVRPVIPGGRKWDDLARDFRKADQQRIVKNMVGKIVPLMSRFPWICGMYSQILSLESVADVLTSMPQYNVIFNIENIFKKLLYFWRKATNMYAKGFNEQIAIALSSYLLKHIEKTGDDISKKRQIDDSFVKSAFQWLQHSKDLLSLVVDHVLQDKYCNIPCVTFSLTIIDSVVKTTKCINEFQPNRNLGLDIENIQKDLLSIVYSLIYSKYYHDLDFHYIDLWNMLSDYKWTDEDFRKQWSEVCKSSMVKAIPDKFNKDTEALLKFYSEKFEEMKPNEIVTECFTDVVTKYVENGLLGQKSFTATLRYTVAQTTGYLQSNLLKVCMKIFKKQWLVVLNRNNSPEDTFLDFLRNWPPASAFLRILSNPKLQSQLRDEHLNVIRGVESSLQTLVHSLRNGSILVHHLQNLNQVQKSFWDSYEAINQNVDSSSVDPHFTQEFLNNLIAGRWAELNSFYETKRSISIFVAFALSLGKDSLVVNVARLNERLTTNVVNLPLCQLVECQPYVYKRLLDVNRNHHVIFFQLEECDQALLSKIHQAKAMQSTVVKKNMRQAAIGTGKKKMTVHEFLQEVWIPAMNQSLETTQKLDKGTIQLQELKDMFEQIMETNGIGEVEEEMQLLYELQHKQTAREFDKKRFARRFDQIKNYFTLRQNIRTAKTLDIIRERLKLEGNFDTLIVPLELGQKCKEKCLNTITNDLITMSRILEDIKHDQIQVLVKFASCDKLIDWLKEHMKNMGEVKVMSDLAMISAGETPMEVDRVSCFLSAVMGFAPLIFDLEPESGLHELLGACREVWRNVKRDPTLLTKWIETSNHLEWLTSVKDSHGSVEKSSLTRAQMINSEGVYKIGGEKEIIPSVENCLKLFLKNNKDDIIMTLTELRDLQSRLMLIAGEADIGRQDVTRFIDVLSSVENLAKTYVKLKVSGCLLFSNWTVTIRCTNDHQDRGTTIQVFFDNTCPAISSREDVLQEVMNLTKVLHEAHKEWIHYLNEKRNEHFHLNHYNIHQLTYMCKELAKNDENDFPDQVYTLLASVADDVTFEKIVDYLDEATRIEDDEQEVSMIQEDEGNVTKIQKKKKVVRKLVQLELSENVAKAAVQVVTSLDIDECYLWGLENEFDEEKVEKHQHAFDEEVGFEANGANINVIQNVINERLNLTLEEVIQRIQEDLEDNDDETLGTTVKTVCERYFKGTCVTSLTDCVSLEHLGQFLAMLGAAVDSHRLPNRTWPDQFVSGKPNLIVCPQVDTWRTILSIYISSPEEVLPSASEVLVCCESTKSEEVELLLRRAISCVVDEGKRVFCLACANELPFEVAKETEEIFEQLTQMQSKNDDYRLVIITSSNQHYITSIFNEHQIDGNFLARDVEIKGYLKEKCVKNIKEETASKVDRDQSSVRVVQSERAGMGKSLYIQRCHENLSRMFQYSVFWNSSTIRFLEKDVNIDDIIESLTWSGGSEVANADPHFIHIDITPSVLRGVHKFLFDLVVLRTIKNNHGVIWRHRPEHFYAIEYTMPSTKGVASFSNLLDLLPSVICLSPLEVKGFSRPNEIPPDNSVLMDTILLHDELYQRPFQYLVRFANKQDLFEFTYKRPIVNALECLETLLKYCSMKDPSWLELSHFSRFLNTQVRDCENSVFCNKDLVGRRSGLQQFKHFVVRFMIRMSQDFATPSLQVTDDDEGVDVGNDLLELHQLRRRWEGGFHPYLFFNDDRASMSFVHFNINAQGDLCHPKTNEIDERSVMPKELIQGLQRNGVRLRQDFDQLSREDKIATLCQVFGVNNTLDPDKTYELTTDNVLKMLAIHMRFRCGIPVVVMGETGCGKTRMIEFMCKLKAGGKENVQNMVIVKVHGGITVSIIQEKVREAVKLAEQNKRNGNVETILFLDEANTTEAIYAIKEIVCDGTVHGQRFTDAGLKIVAACNPYRKHTDEEIQKMEKSGLGYHVRAEDANEKFAGIPMRQLVYRVISLPPSMQPLVWDFGQLNNDTEEIYIKQMVIKLQRDINEDQDLPDLSPEMTGIITRTLAVSQRYMREKRDVCSFVSLRDVERTIQSFKWFYKQMNILSPMVEDEKKKDKQAKRNITRSFKAVIQALGLCYHVTLDQRLEYREFIAKELPNITEKDILDEIVACQNVFINEIQLENDIARNEALRENVFMIVVCAEMRIPLFLVGKPGSSKSLAKTIVTDAMQGRNSRSELFKKLKQIQVLSFQCSAVSDAVGIETVFSQCAQLQKNQDLNNYVAVVVLDEIGLAEDSKKMPLKVLHPLLETASTNSRLEVEPHCKVGFVGISNWALDPAKMNRGIFVTRGEPTKEDLHKTAEAIFESDKTKIQEVGGVIRAITDAYMEIYKDQKKEFFGLRDYYSLLKMIFRIVSEKKVLELNDVARSVLRNFSGYSKDVSLVFNQHFMDVFPHVYRLHTTVTSLIHENLNSQFESRFLLLLTKQFSAVSLLPNVMGKIKDYQVIFGSSFPHDHDYTEVCRNINRIKVCMESGRAVVLLNLRDLYESLYDALNQHYVTFADQRYIDLGLGGHRVKCRVAPHFRLIVIEEKDVVYDEFPIPLINRLEKYVFEMSSILSPEETTLVNRLKEWVMLFSNIKAQKHEQRPFTQEDSFAGFKDDTPASALLSADKNANDRYEATQKVLLQTASLDAVCRLPKSDMARNAEKFRSVYMEDQEHDTLWMMLKQKLACGCGISVFEVTTFSQILNEKDRQELEKLLELEKNRIMLMTLQQFQTEQEYSGRLEEFFTFTLKHNHQDDMDDPASKSFVLLIQCPQAHSHGNLIACAKYSAMNKVKQFKIDNPNLHCTIVVTFLFTLERHTVSESRASFTSFHSQDCSSLYIDELRPRRDHIAPVSLLWNMTVSHVLTRGIQEAESNNPVIKIHRLIEESIPDAMGKLKNQFSGHGRNRVRILNELCFGTRVSQHFLQIIVRHTIRLVEDRERKLESNDRDHWIVEEACNPQALQEGGSFRNTIWLCLRKLVAVALAKVVSVADVDNNLDLVANLNEENLQYANIWLQIFDSDQLFDLQWSTVTSDVEFVVRRNSHFYCEFPFFRLIHDKLLKQWLLLQALNIENKYEIFLEKIQDSPLQSFLAKATELNSMASIKRFVHDLVYLKYKSQTADTNFDMEFEVVQDTIVALFTAQRKLPKQHCNALVEIFVIFMEIQPSLQQFAEVIAVSSDILGERQQWVDEQSKTTNFTMQQLAFKSLLKKLQADATKSIGSLDTCKLWKSLVAKAKQIADVLVVDAQDDIKQLWKQIEFVEIFLDQLIPSSVSQENVQHYLTTLSPLARRLWTGASRLRDLSNLQFLNIITKTLQGCTKEINLRILCSWNDIKCKACKSDKLNNPVLLPCKHYICHKCVPLGSSDSRCPICPVKIANIETLRPLEPSPAQRKEMEMFDSACTSFFLEYLSVFCFPPPQLEERHRFPPPDEKITLALEKLVICDSTTKAMSPLLSKFDTNPTARSYILQLLLRYDSNLVERQLEEHFKTMEEVLQDKGILMDIYNQCIQDNLQNQSRNNDDDDRTNVDLTRELLQECVDMSEQSDNFSQIQHLNFCAKLQFIARVTVSCIITLENEDARNFRDYQQMLWLVRDVSNLVLEEQYVVMRQFIIKNLCRRHGMDAFNVLLNHNTYKRLIPPNLLPGQDAQNEDFYLQSDLLVLAGEGYVRVKTLLMDVATEEDLPRVFQQIVHEIQQSADSIIQILLALSVWTAQSNVDKNLRRRTFEYIVGRLQMHLSGRINQQIFRDVSKASLDFQCDDVTPQMQYKITELLTMLGVTLLCSEQSLLSDLGKIITKSDQMMKSFLPTMPASNFFEVRDVIQSDITYGNTKPKTFLCPDGHVYFIGECTNPVQAGKCPECRKDIGGQKYGLLHAGNQAGEITEESQAGYKLGRPEKRTPVTPERKLTKLSVCALRVCLHASMLLAARHGTVIKRMIDIQGGQNDVHKFLIQHIIKDLTDLSDCLGRSIDDTFIIMHQIFHRMRSTNVGGNQQIWHLQTMAAREVWEEEFQRQFLSLVFRDTDAIVNRAQNVLVNAGKLAEKPLQRLVYELKKDDDLPGELVRWNCQNLWKYRIHVDMKHLRQRLEVVDVAAGGEGAALKVILSVENLELLKHLHDILSLQSTLIARYSQRIDMVDADDINLREYLEEDNFFFEDDVNLYIKVWNKVRDLLVNCDRYNTPRCFFAENMNLESPISMCLPSKRGRGCCALVMAEYLVDKQNNLLHQCRELINPHPTFATVDLSKRTTNNIICISENKDLMPLVLANSQYETTTDESGPKHSIAYNLGLLEKKVLEKFILRKAYMEKETIPLMQYPQDVGLAKDFETVLGNGGQVPLPIRMCQSIDTAAEDSMTANICEVVRTITLVIQFLAKLGGELERTICDYAEKDLLLLADETEMIPRSAQICHCLALYERLSWHRSRRLVANGQNPFESVIATVEDIEDEELIRNLQEEFSQMNIPRLQMELNTLLMIGPEMNPEYSLGEDVLLVYMDDKYDGDNSWCAKIPAGIMYKNAVHVFKLSME